MNIKIFETKYWKVELLDNQYYLGRSYIILKRDCKFISQLTNEEAEDLFRIIKKMEVALKKAFGTTMFNWTCLMNDSYKSKTPKHRIHLHLWPRYKGKIIFGGETFVDEFFGHHYDKFKIKKVKSKTLKGIVSKIKKEI